MTQKGFSLLELSIVLVIIGLIAGGIVAGASMIRAAELRSVITEFQQYQTAVHTFKDKYLGLPGDLKNAYDFWGVAAGCIDDHSMSDTTGCNGDGDGNIEEFAEGLRAWQHLALAGLINGNFTGSDAGNDAVLGSNVPESKMNGGGYQFFYHDMTNLVWTGAGSTTKNISIRFAAMNYDPSPAPDRIGARFLNCEESWSLDKKMDDGRPGTGKLILHYFLSSPCISTSDMPTAEYVLDNTNGTTVVDYQYRK
jgi:prepilin-type N-terminal cleavage/methylation domain-containing protein